MGTENREVSCVKFLSQGRILLVQRETSGTRKGREARCQEHRQEAGGRPSTREANAAMGGAATPQSLCFMNVSAPTENTKERALGSVCRK